MPAETKLRIANSDPFFEVSDLWEVKNFDDLDFHDLCQQMASKSRACYILTGLGLGG